MAAAFVEAGVTQGHPRRADHAQRRRLGADRARAHPHRRRAGPAEHAAGAPGTRRATAGRLRAVSGGRRGVPRAPLPRRAAVRAAHSPTELPALREVWTPDQLPQATGRRRPRDRRRDRRDRHRGRHPGHHVHVGKQRAAERRHPLARQRAGRRAVRPRGAVHRRRHPAVPADAVLLGGRLRQRHTVGAAGRRHAGHRGDSAAGDHASPAGTRAGDAVSRLARPGRSACPPVGLGRCRPVRAAAGQPGGAAARRPTGRAGRAGQVVRDDGGVRAVLRLSRRHRHAAIGMGQLRQAVRRHRGPHRRPRHRRTRAARARSG